MIDTIQLFRARGHSGAALHLATAAAGLLMLAACFSEPQPPTSDLQAAELAIANAEHSQVAGYASAELSEARDKLRAANIAVQDKKMVLAQRLAVESRVDAELSAARADAVRAGAVNHEMSKSIDTLKQEMQRNSGDE